MGISQTSQQPNPEDDMKRVTSPWDSLSANEIEQAARAIRARHGDATIFNRISLSQPEKSVALQWQAGQTPRRSALISFRAAKQTHHATYDFNAASLSQTETLTSGQPMLTSEGELKRSVAVVHEDESVLAALAKRDVAAGDALCLPRTTGRFFSDKADPAHDRLLRLDYFFIKGQTSLEPLPSGAAFFGVLLKA
jgi:Cu2+-containing amine oxidase